MAYCPPERSPRAPATGFPKGRARKRKRTPSDERRTEKRAAEIVDSIDGTAQARHRAWLAREMNTAESCTTELVELYGKHRGEQAGTLTDPYYGRTSAGRAQ
jgi:hypothetical protein